jgi:serine/threonine protein kinase, bacterial
MHSHTQLSNGATFAGFTIIRLLGSGGMGEVYLVKHPRLPRNDALKILPADVSADSEFRARFNREADLASALWHPNIVGVRDRGESEGLLWIAMDYVEGTDAAKLLTDRYPAGMPQHEVAEIVTAIADALDYAHENRLLHRDVKPANILLTEPTSGQRRILLADFGIARQADDVSGLTATNMTVGSVLYAAPEQLTGEPLDGRADQYALAATAYHLLTGQPPFSHSNPAVVIGRHLNTPAPKLADQRSELAALDPVMTAALSKDPAGRFNSCQDFALALTQRLGTEPGTLPDTQAAIPLPAPVNAPSIPAAPPTTTGARSRWRRRPVLWGVPAAIIVLIAAAILAVIRHDRPSSGATAAPAPPLAVLDGTYRLVYDNSKETVNGAPLPADPSMAADNTRWWSFRSFCRDTECTSTATELDAINPKIAHDPAVTSILHFVDGRWQETPRRSRQSIAQCLGVDQKVVAGTAAELDAFSMDPQVDGTLRGVLTTTIVTNECGREGSVLQKPFVATRTSDRPAGIVVTDPAGVITSPTTSTPAPPTPGPILDGAYRLDYDDAAQTIDGNPVTGSPTTDTGWWAYRSMCTPTQCVATAAELADNNQQEPSGPADVFQFIDGQWQDTPNLRVSEPCDSGTGTTTDLISSSMRPQPDGTLSGLQTDSVIDGDCGPHKSSKGKVYKTPFRMTRTGDVPPSAILADPSLFMS